MNDDKISSVAPEQVVADWGNRRTDSLDGWINELATLAEHHASMPGFVRSAMKTIAQGLHAHAPVAASPEAAPAAMEGNWQQYAKDGEMAQDVIERERGDSDALLSMLAKTRQVQIDEMVSRFLGWRLPDDFCPDCGVSFNPLGHPNGWPVGTNLLSAEQARQMFTHALYGTAATPAAPSAGVILTWSEPREPDASCGYNHVIAKTPFGRFVISWKGWKDCPGYDIDEAPIADLAHSDTTLEGAKAEAQRHYSDALLAALAQPAPVQAGAQQAVVLSDDEIDRLQEEYDCFGQCDAPRIHDFARGVEKAVLTPAAPTQAGAGDAKGGTA